MVRGDSPDVGECDQWLTWQPKRPKQNLLGRRVVHAQLETRGEVARVFDGLEVHSGPVVIRQDRLDVARGTLRETDNLGGDAQQSLSSVGLVHLVSAAEEHARQRASQDRYSRLLHGWSPHPAPDRGLAHPNHQVRLQMRCASATTCAAPTAFSGPQRHDRPEVLPTTPRPALGTRCLAGWALRVGHAPNPSRGLLATPGVTPARSPGRTPVDEH